MDGFGLTEILKDDSFIGTWLRKLLFRDKLLFTVKLCLEVNTKLSLEDISFMVERENSFTGQLFWLIGFLQRSLSLLFQLGSFWGTRTGTVRREIGLLLKSSHSVILGDWDKHTVQIDFDNMEYHCVLEICRKVKSWFRLQGFLVLNSSVGNYHVVFNRRVSWTTNVSVMGWISLLSKNEKVKDYVIMQCVKGSSTLRIGPKGDKPYPRIVFREGRQDGQIKWFLYNRRIIKDIVRRLENDGIWDKL